MTATELPRRLRDLPLADVPYREAPQRPSLRVPVAVSLPSRLLGLAFVPPGRAGEGLLIPRCRSVHTFGMRFPVEVVFLDRSRRPLSRRASVPPRRVVFDRRASAVLERPIGGTS